MVGGAAQRAAGAAVRRHRRPRRRALLASDAERTLRFVQRRFEPLRETWTAALDPRDVDPLLDEAAAVAVDSLVSGEGDGGR